MTIGIDIGGTSIRAGIVSQGSIIHQHQIVLKNKHSLSATLSQLFELIKQLTVHPIKGIGIGVPSVVDIDKGIVYNVANIPSWEKVALKQLVEEKFGLPVCINNDVNCFVLGEHRHGLGKAFGSLIGITLGTGMGCGIIINGELYNGQNCGAGEIGLIPYLDSTLETYVGSRFFINKANKSAEEAWKGALAGNKEDLDIWQEFGGHLGHVLKIVLYAYDPEAIILGGSIAKAYSFFEQAMWSTLKEFEYPNSLKQLKVSVSQQNNIALLGAASLIVDPHYLSKGNLQ